MKKMIIFILISVLMLTGCTKKEFTEDKITDLEKETEGVFDESDKGLIAKDYIDSDGNRIIEYTDGYITRLLPNNKLVIVRYPLAPDYTKLKGNDKPLLELPINESSNEYPGVNELRSKDLSKLDLTNELDYLLEANFDDHTIWPERMPAEFDINKIAEYGMDPGLGLRELHSKGIDGKGVGIAIIDQELLVEHNEYMDNLKHYEEIHINNMAMYSTMHGPAVASVAVGKNVGVAPESDLYYIATSFDDDMHWLVESIDRIVEINKKLLEDRKIRVISISFGISDNSYDYEIVKEAIDKANKESIYVINTVDVAGTGREIYREPNEVKSYGKGYWWRDLDINILDWMKVMVPMDSRYLASPTGKDAYVFYRDGGFSWAVPYEAGLYALCCQVNPDITPVLYEEAMIKTANVIKLDGKNCKIVNPKALIEEVKENNK